MTDRKLMQMALDEIERLCGTGKITGGTLKLSAALRDRLAQPEPDAVLVEREACARIVEADADARGKGGGGLVAASRIRARGEK
jgi:hypothetical protein